ncbi:MAG: biopolymer transporter ExbD [Flavobacteriaceae bacterium]|nr:biopolymer transporter ExbD [Flavobacteriaceae bacterium]
MARRDIPEINAGSMADIAFLLLIFFLVTTTMDVDSGIIRKLPEKSQDNDTKITIKEKNVLDIVVNHKNDLLIENEIVAIKDVKKIVMDFIDNGGGLSAPKEGEEPAPCDYCEGKKDPKSSDHPTKAIVSLQSARGTTYGMYITLQNQIEMAYNELRNRLSKKLYNMTYDELLKAYKDSENKDEKIKAKIDNLKEKYPQIISEPEPLK